MKKIAFTCAVCGTLNIPLARDHWKGFVPCRRCGDLQNVTNCGKGKTESRLYHIYSEASGLSVTQLIELQKRGLLPRDLAAGDDFHRAIVCVVSIALSSEEILRGALAKLPKERREKLLHPIPSDGLLTRWQRDILQRYTEEYERLLQAPPEQIIGKKKPKRFGVAITTISDMIRYLEKQYGLPSSTSRPAIKRLKKIAYNRARRGLVEGRV